MCCVVVCGTAWSAESVQHCCLWYSLLRRGCATLLTVCGTTWSAEAVQHCWLSVIRPGQLSLCNTVDCLWYGLVSWGCATLLTLWYGLVSWGCATLLTMVRPAQTRLCNTADSLWYGLVTWGCAIPLTVCGTVWSDEAVQHCSLSSAPQHSLWGSNRLFDTRTNFMHYWT